MDSPWIVLAIVLATLPICGWLLLLVTPVVMLGAAVVGDVAVAVNGALGTLPAIARRRTRGILCLDGVPARFLAGLRADLVRMLAGAPRGRARACACIRKTGDGFVGVLRVFHRTGHFLLRVPGASTEAVAWGLSQTLDELRHRFPVRAGTRRQACPECDPRTCPLRRLAGLATTRA